MCGKDGSIVFTSVRDGDIELYRMDADGKNVKRLTHDARLRRRRVLQRRLLEASSGARRGRARARSSTTTSACWRRTWCARRKLELYVANADGSDARQVTYLDAASFAPSFQPGEAAHHLLVERRRSARARVRPVGDRRRRHAAASGSPHAPGFDGFPLFSPDGKRLAFASNRATAPGAHDTNVFVARWKPSRGAGRSPRAGRARRPIASPPTSAGWPIRRAQGRGVGTRGPGGRRAPTSRSGCKALGLEPARRRRAASGSRSRCATGVEVEPGDGGDARRHGRWRATDFSRAGFSAPGKAAGPLVLAGYGIVDTSQRHRRLRGPRREGQDRARAPLRARARRRWRRPSAQRRAGRPAPARPGWRASAARAALLVVDLAGAARRPRAARLAARRDEAPLPAPAPDRLRRRRASRCCWSSARRWRPCCDRLAKRRAA